jgi:hypothetical protein
MYKMYMVVQGVLVPRAVQGARVRHPREGGGRPSLQSGQRLGRQHQQGQVLGTFFIKLFQVLRVGF